MKRKPFCWVVVPSNDHVKKITSFWRAVAHLAQEGKDVLCDVPTIQTLNQLQSKNIHCDELVVIGLKGWDTNDDVRHISLWAKEQGISQRVMSDEQWVEVDVTAKSIERK